MAFVSGDFERNIDYMFKCMKKKVNLLAYIYLPEHLVAMITTYSLGPL